MTRRKYHPGPASHYFHVSGRPCRVVTVNMASDRIIMIGSYDSRNNERLLKQGSRLWKMIERHFIEVIVPAVRRQNQQLADHPSVQS